MDKKRSARGAILLSINEVAQKLNVTRVTIYRWISLGLLEPQGSQVIGNRHHYWFDPIYIGKVKALIPKGRNRGLSILTRQSEENLKRLALEIKHK